MLVEMIISGLAFDPSNNAPIVILRERSGERIVPIWIGVPEASAIALELENTKFERPMTHDLLKTTIEAFGGVVEEIAINSLKSNTYHAVLCIDNKGEKIEIDCRPSDAIALALRVQVPILCAEEVVEAANKTAKVVNADSETSKESAPQPPELLKPKAADPKGPRVLSVPGEGSLDEKALHELLENLDPEDFGKYKM